MTLMRKPAVEIRQGDQTVYFTTFTVNEIVAPGFCGAHELESAAGTGYQRIPEKKRWRRLAADMAAAHRHPTPQALLPTSILLATDLQLKYSRAKREISFESDPGPGRDHIFFVVDGQHRINGMRHAAMDLDPSLADFPLAVVIVPELGDREQMLHFYLVNTTQKSVEQGITQHIQSRLTEVRDIGTDVFMPARLEGVIRQGAVKEALGFAQFLNGERDSPWHNRMIVSGSVKGNPKPGAIPQRVFVQSAQKHLLGGQNLQGRGHWLVKGENRNKPRQEVLRNYWRAVEGVFTDEDAPPERSVAFKHNGVVFFHTVSRPLFQWLDQHGDFRVEKIKQLFGLAFQHLPPEHDGLRRPSWWKSGGEASGINKEGIRRRAGVMMSAIEKARRAEQGEDKA